MSKVDALKHPIDTLKTAPFGFAVATPYTVMSTIGAVGLAQNPDVNDAVLFVSGIPGIVLGGLLAARQFKFRKIVEERMASGLDKPFLESNAYEWCARQTIRTTLKGTPHFANYEAICKEREETARFRWLPHL